MKAASRKLFVLSVFLALDLLGALGSAPLAAQGKPGKARPTSSEPTEGVSLPRLIKFTGMLQDRLGQPRTGVVGVTFALYEDLQGGAPLWLEVQNLELDEQGRYTVLLGATQTGGLPLELFAAGRARWLGIQVQGEEGEQGRILLVSVPYALKAGDAETLGGKPASAFVLAAEQAKSGGTGVSSEGRPAFGPVLPAVTVSGPGLSKEQIGGGGTANFVAKFTGTGNTVSNSALFENAGNMGLGSTNVTELSQHRLFIAKDVTWPNDTVNSQLALGGATNPARQLVLGYDTTNNYGFIAAGEQAIGWRDLILQQNGGNLGIGTRNPAVKLQADVANPFPGTSIVSSALTNGSVDILTTDPQGADIGPILALGGNRATTATNLGVFGGIRGAKENSTAGDTAGYLGFYTMRGGFDFAERMRITNTGNVGIGTTTPHPLARLTIDSVGAGGILLRGGWRDILAPDTENLQIGHISPDGTVFTERMRITPTGNVGIGTTAPAEKLTVTGNIAANGTLTGTQVVSTVAGGTAPLLVTSTTLVTNLNADFLDGLDSTAFALASSLGGFVAKAGDTMTGTLNLPANGLVAGTNQLVLSGGNIGIGTASPATLLDVSGASTLRGTLSLPATGTATALGGFPSNSLDQVGSVWDGAAAVNRTFRWLAEDPDNNTTTPSQLTLLFGSGVAPTPTGLFLRSDGTINFAAGQIFPGSVTSVGLSAPAVFSVTGSPVTSSGTLALAFAAGQPANQVLATPDGATGALGLRALVAADIPTLDAAKITSGVFGIARGGTALSTYTLGDIIYSDAANSLARLAGNITTAKQFLTQTGTGTASAAPTWGTIADADLPTTIVRTTRAVNTAAPLGGGGALAADLTLTCASCEVTTNKNAANGYAGLDAATKLVLAQGQEVWAATDLTTYAAESGIGTTALRATVTAPASDDALAWDGTNWVNQNGHTRVLCRAATQVDVVNSTVETSVFSCSIPANLLGTIRAVRLTLIGDYLNNSAATQTFTLRIKFGVTTMYSDLSTATAINAARRAVLFNLMLANQNATNAQVLGGSVTLGRPDAATLGLGDLAANAQTNTALFGSAAEDTTLARTFDVTIQHTAANANVSFRRQYAVLELM